MLGPIPDHYGLDLDGLFQEIHRLGHLPALVGFLDESFLASEFGAERTSVIDEYLRRRGWQETPRAREYLQGIRSTPPSLYEVRDIARGEWVELRDRLREEPPERVSEHAGSQTLQRWDCIVARIVRPRGEPMLTGGVLSLNREMAERIEELLGRVRKKSRASLGKLAEELGADPAHFGDVDDAVLQLAETIFVQVWLKGLLDAARRPLPELQNTDGHALLFATTRLSLASGASAEIEHKLDRLSGWEREPGVELHWVWTTGPDDPPTILGTARLENDALVVETNSHERMERALEVLHRALGDLVHEGLTSYADPAQVLRDRPRQADSTRATLPSGVSAEEAADLTAALHQVKDAHYRRTLDEPVPMLGNRTPRACARSKQGRARIVRWLKELENSELKQAARSGEAAYNLAWMWRELGVEDER